MRTIKHPSWILCLGIALGLAATSCGGSDEWPLGIEATAIDLAADPCEDFYRYACGGFIDQNPLSATGAIVARRAVAFFATEDVEREILKSPPQNDDGRLLGWYDSACRSAGDGTQDRTALDATLTLIDAAKTPADIAKAVAALHAVGGWALFSFGATRDLANPGKLIAGAGDASLGMPDRFYYLEPMSPERAAYIEHIAALSKLVGLVDGALPTAVIKIETALASAMLPEEDQRDPANTFHPTDRAAFEAKVPSFDWATYRSTVGAPSYSIIDVVGPAYFDALEVVLKGTSMADVQRYLRWMAIEAFAGAMGDTILEEESAFHRGVFYGAPTPLPRDVYCLRSTASALSWSMGKAYVDRVFPPAAGQAADELASAMRGALDRNLSTVTWLDAPTRAAAKAKLAAMEIEVGAPKTWPSITGLTFDPMSFVASYAAVETFWFQKRIAAIGVENESNWFLSPAVVNAAYSPTVNAVNLPAAILQAPFFEASYAPVVRFGAMGSVVGHEMTHGFDDFGRLFDATGKLESFWSKTTEANFQGRAKCLVDQYDAIEGVGGFVNGELTLGENIADLGGVKLAYAAAAPEEEIDKKAFFVAYAQAWCSNIRPEYAATLLLTDPHAPDRARVNAVLANVPEFAEAFSCDSGSKMAPVSRCEVW